MVIIVGVGLPTTSSTGKLRTLAVREGRGRLRYVGVASERNPFDNHNFTGKPVDAPVSLQECSEVLERIEEMGDLGCR